MNRLADDAERYAQLSWYVLPVYGIVEGQCTCGQGESCSSPGKHPRIPAWQNQATTDVATIRRWWKTWPHANIGVVAGKSGLVVLDIDPKHGGDNSLDELIAEHGALPDTREQITGGGGRHILFKHPGGYIQNRQDQSSIAPGVDIKANGGFFVAAPSLHSSGNRYQWDGLEDAGTAELPAWLKQLLMSKPTTNGKTKRPVNSEKFTDGQRHRALLSYAGKLRHAGCGPDEVLAALLEFNRRRCSPPKSETEVRKLAEDIAQRYETGGATESEKPRPEIKTNNRQLRDVGGEASSALVSGNDPPSVFVRGGRLVRVRLDENNQPIIDDIGEAEVRVLLAQRANFVRVVKDREAGGFRLSSVSPPTDVTRYVAALGEWELPPLEAVTESPVLRADGSILSRVGYDAATKLFYHRGPELSAPDIPDTPDRRDAQAALTKALDPIAEFPFADGASKANAMAAMLTPVVRMAVEGNVPIALLDAPQMGSGKSLLAAVITIVATGRDEMMPAPSKEEEWQKVITSCLLRGTTINVIDNIEQPVQSAALAAVVTSNRWTDRILGRSEMVTLRNHAVWLVTGNNIRLRADLPRRCFWIRLDAKMSRPYERADFRHDDLKSWVRDHRGEILAALLTMARAWFVAACPPPQKVPAPLGSFEQWTRTVGGILEYAGVQGFLGNQHTLYEQADEETPQWETFLQTWHEHYGADPMSTSQLIGQINLDTSVLRPVLPDTLADALESKKGSFQIKLGKTLGKHVGVRYGRENYRLVREDDTHTKSKLWIVTTG